MMLLLTQPNSPPTTATEIITNPNLLNFFQNAEPLSTVLYMLFAFTVIILILFVWVNEKNKKIIEKMHIVVVEQKGNISLLVSTNNSNTQNIKEKISSLENQLQIQGMQISDDIKEMQSTVERGYIYCKAYKNNGSGDYG